MRHHPHHRRYWHHRPMRKTPGTVSPLRRSQRPRQSVEGWRVERVEFVLMTTEVHRNATRALSALFAEWITRHHATNRSNPNNDHTKAA